MSEKTKKKEARGKAAEKSSTEKCGADEKGNWGEDQKEKSYYYDDSYGYEVYKPDEDDEEPDVSSGEK